VNIIIIGGSSFLGRNIIEELTEGDYVSSNIAATYLHDETFPSFTKGVGVEAKRYNMQDDNYSWENYDVCIYLAGNSDHSLAAQDPSLDLSMNTAGLLHFLKSFHGHLVYMSSGAVYYGHKGYVRAGMPLAPLFAYGISKLACEHYIQAAHYCNDLASFVNTRLFYAYGKHDKNRRLIPQVVRTLVIDGKNEFCVHGNGCSFVDPLDARYVARVLAKAANTHGLNSTFDLCGGHNQTVIDLVHNVAKVLNKDLVVSSDYSQETFPVEFYSNSNILKERLNIEDPPSLEEGINAYSRWLIRK